MSFDALMQTMTALNDVHNTLLELAEQKKHVLIHNQVEQLMQIVTKENKLLKKIGELDQHRIDAIGAYMIEKGFKPNPKVTVNDLTKIIFNLEDKQTLIESQKQLVVTIRKLREVNALNQQLLEQSLRYINYSLDLLVGPPDDEAIYQNPMHQSPNIRRNGLFDTKA